MAGDSILQYNKKAPTGTTSGQPANNFNRNHEATQRPMDGWKGQIFNYSNQNYGFLPVTSTDPILNSFGSSNRTSTVDKITNVFTVATGLVGLAMTSIQIANAVKTLKSDDNKDANEDGSSSLSALTDKANNCSKKDRESVSDDLGKEIISTKAKKADSVRTIESNNKTKTTATNTINETTPLLDKAKNNLQKFDDEKFALTNDISNLKAQLRTKASTLASMTRTDENATEYDNLEKEIKELENQIESKEDNLEKYYSNEDRKELVNIVEAYELKINKAQKDIETADKNIEKANEEIKVYNKEIKEAEAAKTKLDAKINGN